MKSEAVMQFKRKKKATPTTLPDLSAKGWHYWRFAKYKKYGHFHKNLIVQTYNFVANVQPLKEENFQCTQQF